MQVGHDSSTTGAAWIALGQGNCTFEPVRLHYASVDPRAATVGDFDGDTLPDVVVLNSDAGTLQVLLDRRAP